MIHRFRVNELSMGEKMNQGEERGQKGKSQCVETTYCPPNVLFSVFSRSPFWL